MAQVKYLSDPLLFIEILKYTHVKLSWREGKNKGRKEKGNIMGTY